MITSPAAEWLDRSFSPREKAELGLEIVGAYARARWRLWRTDLPRTVKALRSVVPDDGARLADAERAGIRLGHVVGRTLRHLPFDSRCLMRSLVLTRLLARRGIDSSLVIAVQTEPFGGHAWVERQGVPLLPPAGPPFRRIVEL
jgi:hypothetical protein